MSLFPVSDNKTQFALDAVALTDNWNNGVLVDATNTAARAILGFGGGVFPSNGLNFTPDGQVVCVDTTSGLPANTVWANGLPFSNGALCVAVGSAATYSNGVPFTQNGSVCVNFAAILDMLAISTGAVFSLRKAKSSYNGPCINVRRSSDNAAQDIGFDAFGNLDLDALTLFCGVPIRPLLALPVSSAAYSLRRLGNYNGPAIRVRRSSDNAELDVGFVGNNLNTAALLAFVGAGSGFVSIWYDQSGNSRNATQATAGSQPRIVNAGAIETKNGKPTISFYAGPTHLLASFTSLGNLTTGTLAYVGCLASSANGNYSRAITVNGFEAWRDDGDLIKVEKFDYPFMTADNPNLSAVSFGTGGTLRRSGVVGTALGSGSYVASSIRIHFPVGAFQELSLSEAIWFSNELSLQERVLLEQSQCLYHNITYPTTFPSAFATTWYDQSGNARHATNTTASSQPRIVDGGVVETKNNRPFLRYYGQGLSLQTAARVLDNGLNTGVSLVCFNSSGNFGPSPYSVNGSNVVQRYTAHFNEGGGFRVDNPNGPNSFFRVSAPYTVGNDNAFIFSSTIGPSAQNVAVNGAIVGTDIGLPSTALSDGRAQVGALLYGSGYDYRGGIAEMIIFDQLPSPELMKMLAINQSSYYGVTLS